MRSNSRGGLSREVQILAQNMPETIWRTPWGWICKGKEETVLGKVKEKGGKRREKRRETGSFQPQ